MNKKRKIGIGATAILIMLLLSSFQTIASSEQGTIEKITVSIYNYEENTYREQQIGLDQFMEFFEPVDLDEKYHYQSIMKNKISILYENGLITRNEYTLLENQILLTSIHQSVPKITSKGLFFDLFNLFNGFGFGIKGEQTRSFINLPIAKFPFLNSNISALFTGFNAFDGNGFIFSLGTNGFRYIYNYDRDEYDFPYFSSINGWFIGYTGILLEATVSDSFGEEYEGSYIIGIGMNVMTLWNDKIL